MPVSVTDKQGRLISGLPRGRFVMYDNGRPREVALFSQEDTPVSVALVVDDSGSMRSKQGEVIAAATSFARLSNQMTKCSHSNSTMRCTTRWGGSV